MRNHSTELGQVGLSSVIFADVHASSGKARRQHGWRCRKALGNQV
jgi:hypothetical protein